MSLQSRNKAVLYYSTWTVHLNHLATDEKCSRIWVCFLGPSLGQYQFSTLVRCQVEVGLPVDSLLAAEQSEGIEVLRFKLGV